MEKINVRTVINLLLFVAYMFAVLEHGTKGLFILSVFGIISVAIAYFVLFGIVLWIDILKEFIGRNK